MTSRGRGRGRGKGKGKGRGKRANAPSKQQSKAPQPAPSADKAGETSEQPVSNKRRMSLTPQKERKKMEADRAGSPSPQEKSCFKRSPSLHKSAKRRDMLRSANTLRRAKSKDDLGSVAETPKPKKPAKRAKKQVQQTSSSKPTTHDDTKGQQLTEAEAKREQAKDLKRSVLYLMSFQQHGRHNHAN